MTPTNIPLTGLCAATIQTLQTQQFIRRESIPKYFLFSSLPQADDEFCSTDESGSLFTPYVQNLATHTLVNGAPSNMPSSCGANCSFTLVLDIPYLECTTSVFNVSFGGNGSVFDFPVFNATWEGYVFNVTTYYTFSANTTISGDSTWLAFTQANNKICTPARANYTLDIMYENNVQNVSISRGLVIPLNISSPAPSSKSSETPPSTVAGPAVVFPGFMGNIPGAGAASWYGTAALDWTPPFVSWYRDLQLMALIAGMADSLTGNVIFAHPGIGIKFQVTLDPLQG
jgi:hypothetical protein